MNTDILAEWRLRERHRKQPFITGGVIDPAKWEGAPRKVLFLLKEAYDTSPASQGFDLCELVRDRWKGPRGRTWFQIGRWAHLIQHSKPATIPAYPNSRCEITEAVVASAVVNVRKSGGAKSSDADVIREYAAADGDLLLRQIDGIQPDVVICGGVWNAVRYLWPGAELLSTCYFQTSSYAIIDFWHPAVRWPNELLYFGLAGIIQAAYAGQHRGASASVEQGGK
jgi:hypothetical protein